MNDALTILDIAIWLPIPFAFCVLGLMVALRGENRFAGMLLPFLMAIVGSILYVPLALYLRQRFQPEPDVDFLLRRTSESFPDVVIGVPVLFAFAVLGLVVLLRRENRFAGMLVPFGVVAVLSLIYVPLALVFKPYFSWWVILVPLLLVALVYVVLMYLKDAQTIAPGWAAFLGLLRCTVYAMLAFVFLLPGCQTYDKTETFSKVTFLFDVSGSMSAIDDIPEVGQDPAKLPTRQDKVVKLLTSQAAFVQRVLQKSPITAYRFGAVADEVNVVHLKEGQAWSADDWAAWLKPSKKNIKVDTSKPEEEQHKERLKLSDLIDALTDGTNVGGAALQVAKAESSSFTQAMIIFSDGQSNIGSDEATKEFLARVNNPKRPIQVFTVGVGEYRQPASIRIDDLQAPEVARPDDKFPVRVPVVGTGLQDEDFEVTLELTRVEDGSGRAVAGDRKITLGPKKGTFKGGGDHPNDTVEFEIDLQELRGLKSVDDKEGDLEGTWQFVARVPRNPREAFAKAEHVSEPPTRVLVQKKKLRILLFAGGAGRDYQFVRTLLYREVNEKRIEMSVYLQTGREDHVDQDVESDRLLARFPDTLGPSKEKYMSLNDYDVIVAFDPDWTALDARELKMVKEWVGTHAGGIIFVAGPVYTFHLARPGGLDLSSLLTIYPVVLRDSRLHNAGIGHDPTKNPFPLHFGPSAKLYDFLKLDETGESPVAGWDEFFWGKGKTAPEPGKNIKPIRGFFNYYPVERIKPASIVLATFEGPENSRINDGKDAQPYIVTMPYGNGKTIFIGSAETYRLRTMAHGESFHERFWIKMCRFASAGTTAQKKYGRILLGRTVPTGDIRLEAQLKGEDLQPLAQDSRPTVYVKKLGELDTRPMAFDLKAKPTQGEWQGWFQGKQAIKEPGEYEFKIPITGTSEALTHRLTVRKPNLEMDNLRHNHGALYQIASDATAVLNRLTGPARAEVQKALGRPASDDGKEETKETSRLFFPLASSEQILRCITTVPPQRESTKGSLRDLWDRGYATGWYIPAYVLAMLVPAAVGLLGAGILLVLRQIGGALAFLGTLFLLVGIVAFFGDPDWVDLPVDYSFVLVTVVTLLSVEWLTRKLLKLA